MQHIGKAAVVGTGLMGAGLATLLIGNGIPTVFVGRTEEGCRKGVDAIRANYDELVAAGILPAGCIPACLALLAPTTALEQLAGCPIVFEGVQERVPLKQAVFRQLEAHCPADAVFVSMTSSISPDELCAGLAHPGRLLVAHPWNPPHLVPCVEVVRSACTSQEAVDRTVLLLESLGKRVIILRRNIAGFIGNRIQHAMFREALHLIETGVATAEEIDATVLASFGPRYASIGLMEYYDSVGLDLQYDVQSYLLPTLCRADAPQQPLLDRIGAGDLGPKTGRGFHDWHGKDLADFRRRKNRPYYPAVHWNRPYYPAVHWNLPSAADGEETTCSP